MRDFILITVLLTIQLCSAYVFGRELNKTNEHTNKLASELLIQRYKIDILTEVIK